MHARKTHAMAPTHAHARAAVAQRNSATGCRRNNALPSPYGISSPLRRFLYVRFRTLPTPPPHIPPACTTSCNLSWSVTVFCIFRNQQQSSVASRSLPCRPTVSSVTLHGFPWPCVACSASNPPPASPICSVAWALPRSRSRSPSHPQSLPLSHTRSVSLYQRTRVRMEVSSSLIFERASSLDSEAMSTTR